MNDKIIIKGARENNLKNINIEIPKNQLVVMTGLSGSGKTSLAFDTIYAEGQRRYVESLSAYARQFLGNMEKPDVDSIEGLSPAISIDQKTTSKNPRSTVGTVTEIYDYLRLLYARIGIPYCPTHHIEIVKQSIDEIVNKILELGEGTKLQIIAPYIDSLKGTHQKEFEYLRKEGFSRIEVNNEARQLDEEIILEKNKKHSINVIVDRIVLKEEIRSRLSESVEIALKLGNQKVVIDVIGQKRISFSEKFSCPKCDFTLSELEPRLFSFNAPFGACDECKGLGFTQTVAIDSLIPNGDLSINQGGIRYFKNLVGEQNIDWQVFEILCNYYKIDMNKPLNSLSKKEMNIILVGSTSEIAYEITTSSGNVFKRKAFIEGVKTSIERRHRETTSSMARDYYNSYMSEEKCPVCLGKKLKKEVLAVTVGDKSIMDVTDMSIEDSVTFFENLVLSEKHQNIGNLVLKELRERLSFLKNVGLDYLSLSRTAGTLSGGESQRIRLATQIGSQLSGVLYVLDEPSIGLHQKDNAKLIDALKKMRDLGNSLIVVEHDEDTMNEADYLIDIGPYAGSRGGEVIAFGTPSDVKNNKNSITGKYLSGELKIETPKSRNKGNGLFIEIKGGKENNLKDVDVKFPLGLLTVVTGVSGSGKSTLVNEILYKSISKSLNNARVKPGLHKKILGLDNIDKVIDINQSPIGRTPRSNPATYTSVFDDIRDVFTATKEAKIRGYLKGRFSFNVKGGRCEACQGDGVNKIEMHFLPDVYVECEVCRGSRYNNETLQIKYRNKNISDVLKMSVGEALEFFETHPKIKRKLQTVNDVGLSYITLGQAATTLSGGESQRVKLASELHKKPTGKTVYILDEPTTGLHIHDVKKLIEVLQKIVLNGDSVIVIEHNLEVIKCADHIIDLGPDGGAKGGNIIFEGTPEKIIKNKNSYTGIYLKKVLD